MILMVRMWSLQLKFLEYISSNQYQIPKEEVTRMGSREEEIRTDLKKCDEFLAMTEDSFREDVEESQKLYYEACEDIERIKQEYQQELQRAEKEHFNSDQMKNLHAVYRDEIKDAEEYATEQGKILKREQQRLEQYPALVEQAKKDKAKLEKELSEIPQIKKEVSFELTIVKWAVIALVILFILMKSGILS